MSFFALSCLGRSHLLRVLSLFLLWLLPFSCLISQIGHAFKCFQRDKLISNSLRTSWVSMGVHPKIVQELLGHSTVSITLDIYSHALPSLQEEAVNQLNTLPSKQA